MTAKVRRFSRLLLILGVACPLHAAGAAPVELVSRIAPDQASDTATGSSGSPGGLADTAPVALSANGRYAAFVSSATNLVPGQDDTNNSADVFLRDLATATTVLVSRSAASPTVTANGGAAAMAMSADGNYVAWSSAASDVAAGQPVGPHPHSSLFLYDRIAATNRLLVASIAQQSSAYGLGAFPIAFSHDGSLLLFSSDAPDVVAGQVGSGFRDVFLYDLSSAAVTLVSHAVGSATTAVSATDATMSADGRYVAFNGGSSLPRLLVFDRLTGALQDTGVDGAGTATLSADGRYLAFTSSKTNLVPGQVDTNFNADVFLFDRVTQTVSLVSRASGSAVQTANRPVSAAFLAVSPDGRYVAFISKATDMVPGLPAAPTVARIFLFDRATAAMKLVAAASFSTLFPTSFPADTLGFGGDGRFLVFHSTAVNVISGQVSHGLGNVFLYELASGNTTLVSAASAGSPAAAAGASSNAVMSEDGSVVAFASDAADLVPALADFNQAGDVFSYQVASAMTEALSLRAAASSTPALFSEAVSMSADGRWIAFESPSAHLVSGQVELNAGTDVFLFDAQSKQTLLVSRASGALTTTGDDESRRPLVSADGRYVGFTSRAKNLTSAGQNQNEGVFLFDRLAGVTTLVSRSAATGGPANGTSQANTLSADGRYLAFLSSAPDLVPGEIKANGFENDVYLYDRVTQTISLVSSAGADPHRTGDRGSSRPVLSADGRYVLFFSESSDLVTGQTGGLTNLFLHDRVTGTTALVTHARSSRLETVGVSSFADPSLSADGRYAVFLHTRADLGAATGNGNVHLYLYDRTTGANTLVKSLQTGSGPVLSADGRVIAFLSNDALIAGQASSQWSQLFLYHLSTKTVTLASRAGGAANAGVPGGAASPVLSADGRYVAFLANYPADSFGGPGSPDVFRFDRVAATTLLVSPSRRAPSAGAGGCAGPLIAADGATVAFTSASPDLVADDFNGLQTDAFVLRLGPVTVPTCSLLDTQRPGQGLALRSNTPRSVVPGGSCGVPASAAAIIGKLTVSKGSAKGNVRVATTTAAAPVATVRFGKGQVRSGSFTVPLAADGSFVLLPFVGGNGTVHAVLEVQGYLP